MIIVSNSGPIISFARAGQLGLLKRLFQQIRIPEGVYEDIVVRGAVKPGAADVKSAGWIKKKEVKNRTEVEQLPTGLGLGEREAIILAQELKAALLIDDRQARKTAEERGVVCFAPDSNNQGLRVLKEAKERRLIEEIRPIGDELRATGLRIKDSLYQRFLQEAGE
jgi:predicted nucleic acid-binding protein